MIYSKIMEPINLQILNITGDEFAVDAEDGEKVFQMIFTALKEDKKVNLSFRNITILTTAFLNTAVGQLYGSFTEKFIKENLSVSEITESGKVALKRVVSTAKLYYSDPEALSQSVLDILDDPCFRRSNLNQAVRRR